MLKDVPYHTLKRDERAYEILMLRDRYNNTFAAIAREYGISPMRARQIYVRMKREQSRLYIRHISIVLGHETTKDVTADFRAAYLRYQSLPYACAYLEKKYGDILKDYRAGEPGTPEQVIKRLPLSKREPSRAMIARMVEMRDIEKATFPAIAREMRITPEKAKYLYDSFYHRKVLAHIEALQKTAKTPAEKQAIWDRYFRGTRSPKKRYEMILEEKAHEQPPSPKAPRG